MIHIRLVYLYLLNVPSVSSPYFSKIKLASHLGKQPTLSLEILSYAHKRETCADQEGLLIKGRGVMSKF